MREVLPDSAETAHLLQLAGAGDRSAFDRLLARYRPYLLRVVRLRLDPQLSARVDASDVVQDAQMDAARRLEAYLREPPMPFRLWLRQLAEDRLRTLRRYHLRAARRAVAREVDLPERSSQLARQFLAPGATPSQGVGQHELVRRVRLAMDHLPDADREVLLMRTFDGLSFEKVGEVLGIDPTAARKRHGRALLRLHKVLSEDGLKESEP